MHIFLTGEIQIREHAQVALLTVTRENRDWLPGLLAHFLNTFSQC
ncbi:hypothetical protein SAMN05443529_104143 [Desulfosporosinus hippei DSM 8344]|uniref:Uncharacterized protein n=1 Tax=Desulfosporosinus hippei DSM 8344 TaxID=1121419 RepID=A0A1G7VLZ6_9FIRM|nr:hypothetical protein SAMN05443529_104143 [Desulfosporosinus hippei DSM 8344]